MDAPWLATPPLRDELLSSYLSRCARHHGMRPTRFTAIHLRSHVIWSRDIDRTISLALLERIAAKAGYSVQHLQGMTLTPWERLLGHDVEAPSQWGTGTWLTAMGIYHRSRRRFGLQYCPPCLEESPGFRRTWRLAFVTVCPIHRSPLVDACARCDAPVTPHHQQISAHHCHDCGASLVVTRVLPCLQDEQLADIMRTQQRLLAAMNGHETMIGSEAVPAIDFLRGARSLVSLRRVLMGPHAAGSHRGRRHVELGRRNERHDTMRDLHRLLHAWPSSFLDHCSKRRLTRRSLMADHDLPPWLARTVQHLPAGKRYDRAARPRQVRRALRTLHRRRLPGWRTSRAELLLKNAGWCR